MLKTDSSRAAELTDAAEHARKVAAQAIDDGREFASQAAGKMGDSMRDLRDSAAHAAGQGVDSLNDSVTAAQRQLQQYARAARRQVSNEPLKSALIAAALGAVAATVVLAVLRSRR
jgi:ElaB/YqjD/DUF883 family membrane-anchored ribosome-binding protein